MSTLPQQCLSLLAQIQILQIIRALFGSGGGAFNRLLMCMWVVTSEHRSSDSDRARAAMISESAARSGSPRPSQQPSGRRRTGPCMGSDYDRIRILEVIPNTLNLPRCHGRNFQCQPECLAT